MARDLIRSGANAGALNSRQKHLLLLKMSGSHYPESTEALIQQFGYDEEDLDEAVHEAARSGLAGTDDSLKILLALGGRPNREDLIEIIKAEAITKSYVTFGIRKEKTHIKKLSYVLDYAPYLINSTGKDGMKHDSTPLMVALKPHNGNICSLEAIRILLDHGADPNLQDSTGKTPLMYAASRDRHVVKLLIDSGAESHLQNKKGSFAKNYAKSNPVKTLLRLNNNEKKNRPTRRRGGRRLMTRRNY